MPKAVTNNNNQPQVKKPIITVDIEKLSKDDNTTNNFYVITVYSDEKASKIMTDWVNAKGNNPFKQGRSPKSVWFKISDKSLDKFLQSNMYRVLEGALKYNGFTISPDEFAKQIEREANNEVSDDDMGRLDTSLDNLMNDMLDHFEGKINDPMIEKILSQMHLFDPNSGKFRTLNELLKKNIKSPDNIIRICAQWRNNQRPGVPTYVATKAQWKRDFNRYVIDNATPLVMATPNDNKVQNISKTLNDFGIANRDYLSNSHIRHTAKSIYDDHGANTNGSNGFHGEYVYDISDTEVFPGMPDLFNENEGLESNLWADKWNKKALDSGISPESVQSDNELVAKMGMTNDDNNAEKVKSALETWCEENQQFASNVQAALKRNDLVGAVKAYFENESYIDREKSPNVKNAILNMCVFAALNHYGIAPADMLKSFQASRAYLTNNNKIPKSVRVKFMPFYSNFVNMVETNAKKKQTNECKEYGSQFNEIWNKMIDINNRNHDEHIF